MPSEAKPPLLAQTEKPNHYKYLKEFRVEQCPSFLQHKCTQHRPFTCFHWHFNNQRRRRPVRKRDGSFNYSADNYCTKYNETSGLCDDGDECPFLHRTAGDTERRYHLRYYKTCMCVHDTDARGYCVKNGPHCAFAHGNNDLRPPVYDIKEIQALENPDLEANGAASNGPNVLDKERNLMNEDPKWQDTNYVLSSYKTEACKRPPRLCRQGYACPQYHNSKDKRRSPRKYKYRSTPCPNVKHGEEWGEPGNCDSGDNCSYCHTRTEQQFHPEIYKSTKCNDVQQAGYCPRGVFCAFAHVEQEMSLARELAAPLDCGTNLSDLLSSALPLEKKSSESSNGSGEVSESASTSSLGSNSSHSKAPGAQLQHKLLSLQQSHTMLSNPLGHLPVAPNNSMQDYRSEINAQIVAIESEPSLSPLERITRKQALRVAWHSHQMQQQAASGRISSQPTSHSGLPTFEPTVLNVVGNALDELRLEDTLNLAASLDRDLTENDSQNSNNPMNSTMLSASAPVNIPSSAMTDRSGMHNYSPSTGSPLQLQSGFLSSTRYQHQDHAIDPLFNSHIQLGSSSNKLSNNFSAGGPLFDFQNMSPGGRNHNNLGSFSISPSLGSNLTELNRLREEVQSSRVQQACWDERIAQARGACEAWQRESEEANRKAVLAEQQKEDALTRLDSLRQEMEQLQGSPFLRTLHRVSELRGLSLTTLKTLQAQLRSDLEEIEKVLYLETATKCMVCEEQNRSVTLAPCNHYVLCETCASTQKECPYCQTPVSSQP
ncbi:RING finger protein unk isoform X2 [Arctopsyche grandis]|uniref:RING finger protein unk isoform X2 n=1 Tax=Arctopsyche grandis TaxID=121162 RepID=UPI00406D99AD